MILFLYLECIFDDAASYEFESIIYVTEENVHEYVDSLKVAGYHVSNYGKDVDHMESEQNSYFIAFASNQMPGNERV